MNIQKETTIWEGEKLSNEEDTGNENGEILIKPITLLNEVTGPLEFATADGDTAPAATVLEAEIEGGRWKFKPRNLLEPRLFWGLRQSKVVKHREATSEWEVKEEGNEIGDRREESAIGNGNRCEALALNWRGRRFCSRDEGCVVRRIGSEIAARPHSPCWFFLHRFPNSFYGNFFGEDRVSLFLSFNQLLFFFFFFFWGKMLLPMLVAFNFCRGKHEVSFSTELREIFLYFVECFL